MEKRKLLPLAMTLLTTFCFVACSTPSSETNIIATVNGKQITAEYLYDNTLYNETTAAYVYEILEKALIQSAIGVNNSMKTKVENEVERWRKTIEDNAKLNSTDYDEDLKTALGEEGVNSIDELIEKKIYALQKEYAKTEFLQAKGAEAHKNFIDTNNLYHIGDINLSISSTPTSTDLYNITISSSEAKNIYDAFTELVKGEKYYNVASKYSSGDTASKGGDLGVVTLNDTDITNELRYALIGYSSMYEDKYDSFNLPLNTYTKALTDLYSAGIQTIPYSYIKDLNETYSKTDTSETKNYEANNSFYYSGGGNAVSSTNKVYYRNIVFNSLLNTKVPKFITVTDQEIANGAKTIDLAVLTPNVDTHGYSTTATVQKVLVNEEGNPYVVFKDSKGLHILTINKTPFDTDIYNYYSKDPASDDGYTSYIEFGNNIEDRVSEIESFSQKYITKEYGSNSADETLLSYEIFKYYLTQENGDFKIVDENVKKMIEQYMSAGVVSAQDKIESAFEEYYEDYSNLIWHVYSNPVDRDGDKVTIVTQEIPLLSCLQKGSDGNYRCTYTYGKGFSKHGSVATGGEE